MRSTKNVYLQVQPSQVSRVDLDTPELPSPSDWRRKLPHLICKFTVGVSGEGERGWRGSVSPARTGFDLARKSKVVIIEKPGRSELISS